MAHKIGRMRHTDLTIMRDGLRLAATLDSPDGFDTSGIRTTPEAQKASMTAGTAAPADSDPDQRDVVLIFHGFTADKDHPLLTAAASKVVGRGMLAVRLDFNGHGDSEGDFRNMTVVNEVEDANALLGRVLDGSLGIHARRIFLLGHSQGGVVTGLLGGLYPDVVSGLVLLAPAATLVDDAVCGSTRGLEYDPLHIPALQDYKGRKLGGFYLRTAQVLPVYQIAARFDGPVCLVHGTADQVVDPKASLRYRRAFHHAELHLLDGLDHSLINRDPDTAAKIAADWLADQRRKEETL